jgi:hypothetical protein
VIDLGFGGLLIAAASFLIGKLYFQSESILLKKKEIYQEHLDACATAHEAYKQAGHDKEVSQKWLAHLESIRPRGEFFLYASQEVIILSGQHIDTLSAAFAEIDQSTEALHPAFKDSIQAYNRMLIAMRRDVLGWSIQGISERFFGSKRARRLLNAASKQER